MIRKGIQPLDVFCVEDCRYVGGPRCSEDGGEFGAVGAVVEELDYHAEDDAEHGDSEGDAVGCPEDALGVGVGVVVGVHSYVHIRHR